MSVEAINLREKLARIDALWSPRIVGQVNDTHIKLARIRGEFEWHHHENEDELFLVVSGRFIMQFRDREVWLQEGEMLVVPRGVEHRPVAPEECHILMVEPAGTINTGNVVSDRTVASPEWI
jgi:mannose-6-phosphate isomerase-like protein (cupin superfamily)